MVQQNYFSDLYSAKISDLSAKPFFPCINIHIILLRFLYQNFISKFLYQNFFYFKNYRIISTAKNQCENLSKINMYNIYYFNLLDNIRFYYEDRFYLNFKVSNFILCHYILCRTWLKRQNRFVLQGNCTTNSVRSIIGVISVIIKH